MDKCTKKPPIKQTSKPISFGLVETTQILRVRESILQRKLKKGGLSPGQEKELRDQLQFTRWEQVKLELIINRIMKGSEI